MIQADKQVSIRSFMGRKDKDEVSQFGWESGRLYYLEELGFGSVGEIAEVILESGVYNVMFENRDTEVRVWIDTKRFQQR